MTVLLKCEFWNKQDFPSAFLNGNVPEHGMILVTDEQFILIPPDLLDIAFKVKPEKTVEAPRPGSLIDPEKYPFRCPHCPASFKHEGYLNNHLRKVHGEKTNFVREKVV